MLRPLTGAALLFCASFVLPATAQTRAPNAARDLAAACANCHGPNGASVSAMPYLAGQRQSYIVERMKAFKADNRFSIVMHQIAKGYTDDEIEMMATFFSSQGK
jgi:cytochrome c553